MSISLPVVGAAGSVARHADQPSPAQASDPPDAVNHDVSPPLRTITPAEAPAPETKKEKEPKRGLPIPAPSAPDPVVQQTPGSAAAPALAVGFEGVGQGFAGPSGTFAVTSAPPDPNATVGPSHIVEVVNQSFAVFNKSGSAIYGPVPTNTVWSGFGGGCQSNDDGDATVEYDKRADRWIISQFSVSTTPYLQCVAVSTSGDPTGSYYRYAFQYGNFPDYPKLGVWPDAYYTTFNMFSRHGNRYSFAGPEACAYDRGKMLLGQAATQQCFLLSSSYGSLLPADLDGTTAPPAGSPNYLLSFATNSLQLWKFHVDWTTPSSSTLTGPTTIPVASFSPACGGGTCIPQPGTSQRLDSLADRLMYRLAYRNFGDHESLVVDHSVTAGSSVGVRWYELRNPGGSASVYQQGTYAPDSGYRWMGSIAMDRSGDIALGYSLSSSSVGPSIRYTGRLAGDQLGVMTQGEGTIVNGSGSQTGNLSRWGDYTSMSVDPSDDCTFWYTDEYLASSGNFNWHTRIGSFKFPSCGGTQQSDFSIGASPSALTVVHGSSGTSTISTAVTSGAAQSVSLSVSGLPLGVSASFSPTSVTAGNSSTLTLSVGAGTAPAPGMYAITVTGTGTSATHTTSVSLTVTSATADDFSISANPSSVSVVEGFSAASTISTAVTSGAVQTVTFSASGLPPGASANFTPTSVTAGGTSRLEVITGNAVPGTYALTVTGSGTSATHTTSVSLTITPAAADDFSLSANPSSLSVVQGSSGSSTISTTVTNGSAQTVSFSANVFPTGPTETFSPSSVTAGGSSTMTVSVPTSAAPGTYTIDVTATGTSVTHGLSVTLTVTAAVVNDFSISASPNALSVAQGSSGTSTISTAVTSGAAQSVSLSASGLPLGASASFNPASVTAGGSSTLTVSVGAATASGTYTISVTGTGTSATHTTSVVLTVTSAAAGVVNGGFETDDLSGWAASGTVLPTVVTTAHTGSFAARIGSTGAVNGNSTLTQTASIPSGTSQLTFWYQPHCPDTLTYDQIQMQIRSTGGATLATVLNVCSNSGAWASVSFDTSAWAGQTVVLWFNDHDDGYPTDPTYFLLDDVAVSSYSPPANVVQNPGFELGSLSSWSTSGAFVPVVNTPGHTGTYAARLGSTSAVNGDSTLSQTLTVPSGSPTLSYWYQPHCPDTLTYDQIQMQIRSTGGATLATVLNVCSNSGGWTQVTFPMSAYAGQTVVLWFNDHDDGYPSDPTYFLLDDVSLG